MTDLAKIVSLTLRIGVILSSAFVITGLVLYYLEHDKSVYNTSYYSTSTLLQGLAAGKPEAIILVGVIILIATPVIRVLELGLDFVYKKDKLYVLLSFAVLTVMLIGILLVPRLIHS
ncbi:hypothetical protein B9Q03_04480 [Candidatus Marsarchaeota G2 archaeon OSP_D]|jgi:Predicted membrane protein|uniref:DUF1634 domain-containing protein n=5 Tax=Candidatus Marsarchaeota group 2 TaxID=2203771 RepID=A0A2R6C9I0_9ARCH|nr:MAG: hypothetical protein B9Q03_04480 [Candidatus Marsarchaeota G2 archaeon OSP_D]PSN95144.1 MAG: hypothetical protein B9Q06_06780 [Candidatus Marsarchaeota G2 archaeon ECH_B_2]PSN99760.1 MAG: hypothetical protein B9Q07_05945 [Candidatus Marsarchaeota G2 archaeon ECH_B_3]PSO01965.1 MAG: hypothetical protein B9Q05_06750 [Candidatus Marsarchaeota G2 archaeon ECH_B_1]PSO07557.1 MAG: hypothetical protein B9Q04_10250 [Candidatus Marsarchaeota G2 archaeon BE_D]